MSILESYLKRLRGSTAWITGGKRIGQTVAHVLAEQGVNLVLSYRHSEREAAQAAAHCRSLGVKVFVTQSDVGLRESVAETVARIQAEFGRLDILVNMASVYRPMLLEQVTPEDWESNFSAHVLGTFWPSQLAVPLMPRGSHIVNVSDVCVLGRLQKGNLPYQVTKAALAFMTKAMALEYGERGIFVNAVAPGPILPPEGFPAEDWNAIRRTSLLKYPVSDQEAVEQFAILVLYLCLITSASGHTYPLDHGQAL